MSLEDLDEFGHPLPAFYAAAKRWEAKCKEAEKQRDEAVALLRHANPSDDAPYDYAERVDAFLAKIDGKGTK